MASPIEQLVSNFHWSAWRKARTLKRSLWFLFFAFLAMRLGTFIPLPGVDSGAWAASWASSPFAHLGGFF